MQDRSFKHILAEKDHLNKRLYFVSWLTQKLKRGTTVPVLVGPSALEYYTNHAFICTSVDILWNNPDLLTKILTPYGFQREGRFWISNEAGLIVENVGRICDYNVTILTTSFGDVSIISREDLILDLLQNYKWLNSIDDYQWAKLMIASNCNLLDFQYLVKSAEQLGLMGTLNRVFAEGWKVLWKIKNSQEGVHNV